MTPRRRFDETELGEALPGVEIVAPPGALRPDRLIQAFVGAWAGEAAVLEAVSVSRHLPAKPGAQLWLSGTVYGRHLDGSRRISVRVVGQDHLGDRLLGLVRVQFAA
jgi:hypothetical protein